jgi:hypothetical protein
LGLLWVVWGTAVLLPAVILVVAGFELVAAAAAAAGAAADVLLYCLKMLLLAPGAVDLGLAVEGLQDSWSLGFRALLLLGAKCAAADPGACMRPPAGVAAAAVAAVVDEGVACVLLLVRG